jgi:hypothetical protein
MTSLLLSFQIALTAHQYFTEPSIERGGNSQLWDQLCMIINTLIIDGNPEGPKVEGFVIDHTNYRGCRRSIKTLGTEHKNTASPLSTSSLIGHLLISQYRLLQSSLPAHK